MKIATHVALQADGSVVLCGLGSGSYGNNIAVVRLTNTGQLDPSFDGTGMQNIDFGPSESIQFVGFPYRSTDLALQADGSVVLICLHLQLRHRLHTSLGWLG